MKKNKRKNLMRCVLGVGTLLLVIVFAGLGVSADTVTYNYDYEFSSGTPPTGNPPWLQAVFSDTGEPANTVQLTLSTYPSFSGSEFVSGWYFNLDPRLESSLANLTLSGWSVSSGALTMPSVSLGLDAFKADGDGKYDILFNFANSGGVATEFTAGDVLTVTLSGITGLNASSFSYLSLDTGGHGPYYSAAHVQGISGSYSGWVEPSGGPITGGSADAPPAPDGGSTILLLGGTLIGLSFLRRRISGN